MVNDVILGPERSRFIGKRRPHGTDPMTCYARLDAVLLTLRPGQ